MSTKKITRKKLASSIGKKELIKRLKEKVNIKSGEKALSSQIIENFIDLFLEEIIVGLESGHRVSLGKLKENFIISTSKSQPRVIYNTFRSSKEKITIPSTTKIKINAKKWMERLNPSLEVINNLKKIKKRSELLSLNNYIIKFQGKENLAEKQRITEVYNNCLKNLKSSK